MYDLHCHILPNLDDGAPDIHVALEMARMCQDQNVVCVACTPHILPGVYHNSGLQIRTAVERLQERVLDAGINLSLVPGADNHVVPNFVEELRRGHLLSLADTRYVLVEPPHQVMPPQLADLLFNILAAGFVPVLTHPERLSWIEDQYPLIVQLAQRGVWMQLTAGSLIGRFGRRRKYWSERMLADGIVHLLASDAHNTGSRPPDLAQGMRAAERIVGAVEARNLVEIRPRNVLHNIHPARMEPLFDESRESMLPAGCITGNVSDASSDLATATDGVDLSGRLWNIFSRRAG